MAPAPIIRAYSDGVNQLRAFLKDTGLWLLLFAVLVTRGFIPTGTMPNAAGNGLPWVLCPSDYSSALLIELFPSKSHIHDQHQHHGTAADGSSGQSVSAGQVCKFSALGTLAANDFSLTLPEPVFTGFTLSGWFYRRFAHTPEHQRPWLRGPPVPSLV